MNYLLEYARPDTRPTPLIVSEKARWSYIAKFDPAENPDAVIMPGFTFKDGKGDSTSSKNMELVYKYNNKLR